MNVSINAEVKGNYNNR